MIPQPTRSTLFPYTTLFRSAHGPSAQQECEHRDTQQRGHDPDGQLARGHDGAGQGVGRREQNATREERRREQGAMEPAPHEAAQVRHDQPHEPDHTRDGDGGGGQERRGQIDDALEPPHVGAEVLGAANAPTATPPSSRMRGSSSAPPMSPSRYTSAIAPTAPTNAASGRAQGPGRWSAIAATAPRPAPPDSPSRNGSASGLRTSAWRLVPATPRAPPTRNASTARGNRSCHTIAEPGRSARGRLAGPTSSAAARVARAAPASTTYFTAWCRGAAAARGPPPSRAGRAGRTAHRAETGTVVSVPPAPRATPGGRRSGAVPPYPTAPR